MEHSPCILCLKGVEQRRSSTPTRRQDVANLCKLLTLTPPPQCELEGRSLIPDVDSVCNLCPNCSELIQEMGQIQGQIGQLQNQIGKRVLLLRNMILGSDVKRLGRVGENEMDKLRSIRAHLLRLSDSIPGQDDNFVQAEVEVEIKLEPEDVFGDNYDDHFLEDEPCSSPSAFLLHPDEDYGLIANNEDDDKDSESSFSINPKRKRYDKGKWNKTSVRRSTRRKSASAESGIKSKQKIGKITTKPPPKKKKKLIHKSDTESANDDDPADPDYNIKTEVHEESEQIRNGKNKPIKCPHCAMRFSTQDAATHHVQQYHAIPCSNCDKRFRHQRQLLIHHKSEHRDVPLFQCTICKRKFKRNCNLVEHMILRHETEDKAFFCGKCGKGWTLELNYKRHLDQHTKEDKLPFLCEICDTRFPNQARFDLHAAHHNRKFYCGICSKEYSNVDSLRRHKRIHTGEKPVKCDHCEERFIDVGRKKYHMAKMHSTPDQHHLCPTCGRSFFDWNTLKIHMDRHEGIMKVVCDECGEKFRQIGTMRAHKIEKHGADPLICDECGAKYKSQKGLDLHIMSHRGEKPHKCDICDAAFLRKSTLTEHLTKHSGLRAFPCPEPGCEQRFKTRDHLSRHVKKIHTEGYVTPRPLACSYPGCDRKFEYKGALEGHIRQVHTLERPFVCEVCNSSFSVQNALHLHKKSLHGIPSANAGVGGRLPRSKPQFPSQSDNNMSRRKRGGGNPEQGSSSSDDSLPPTLQFRTTNDMPPSSNTTPSASFYNPSFPNYFPL